MYVDVPANTAANQDMSIWFRSQGGDWQRCGTTFTANSSAQAGQNQNGHNNTDNKATLACVVTQFNTVYGVGTWDNAPASATNNSANNSNASSSGNQ